MGFNECSEAFGNKVDSGIAGKFKRLGNLVGNKPKTTIILTITFAVACGSGLFLLNTENRPGKLWVPQDTMAEQETEKYKSIYKPIARVNNVFITSGNSESKNVLTKEILVSAMKLHEKIVDGDTEFEEKFYTLVDLCAPGSSCANSTGNDSCDCGILSILDQWNFNLMTLENDDDPLATLNQYWKGPDNLISQLGNAIVNNGVLVSAEAFSITYFLESNGEEKDPQKEAWEKDVFLSTVQSKDVDPDLSLKYFSARSFNDEFGSAIGGDIKFVQISYIIAFVFLGATLGRFCGHGSRWAVSLGALVLVALSTIAGIGLSSYFGLFYGPVHSLLPFVLLGIGVDDVFVIVNAFNRERTMPHGEEDDNELRNRSARACARAGASITVTSLTDMVAFAISSSSALPALGSFCAYAAIGVFFLWFFAVTYFIAVVVLDERRLRLNKTDVLCCFKRKSEVNNGKKYEENLLSSYFRKYHAPAILGTVWNKVGVLLVFAGIFAFGIYGTFNLSVEDSSRNFIPEGSYINDFLSAGDKYYESGSTGINLYIMFEDAHEIYDKRSALAGLDKEVEGLSAAPPYIAEPELGTATYMNVMSGLANYLSTNSSNTFTYGNETVRLGDDNLPSTYDDFIKVLDYYITKEKIGRDYYSSVQYSDDRSEIDTIRVSLMYTKLTKESRGETLDDADRQIDAMDATRDMISKWNKAGNLPTASVYSEKFILIEGFKIIKTELFKNTGLAIMAVGIITFLSLGNIVTAILITISVFFCIVEILGFMFAFGLVIDSISVINIVLAVGLSVDYSAHVGHCFMVKSGAKNERVTEALADIGASVLNGAVSTFLAVAVLLLSTSYVFKTLAVQFALTVVLGVAHGLVFLPVLLSLFGPTSYSSADE